jgi:hypothetical protein
MAKTVITGANGATTSTASTGTEGVYAPVKTGRRKEND